ncbi:MAG: DUF3696 domain-containing protein [Lachnospiraceae bacterium]|nr:DUF3696 domain-containing protein [Lachnospiraceae bacterium]
MVRSIEIRNFKCFENLKLPLSEMTILAGGNAAGKSTIMQALLLADATAREKGDFVDASEALGVAVGGPKALISQNCTEIPKGDFLFNIQWDETMVTFVYTIDKLMSLKLSYSQSQNVPGGHLFYLNAERMGPRISYPAGIDEEILSNGANAAFLIDRADMQQRQVPACLAFSGENSKFSIQVENWMSAILGDINFSISTDYVKAITDIKYGNEVAGEPVLPTMTGFGISYILSIVTGGLWCASLKNVSLLVENPEAHLHPAAQSRMGKFLECLADAGVQVIVETHSEHIIDGARIQAARMKKTDDIKIYFFAKEKEGIRVDKINVDENGELSEWPKGFFDQKGQDLRDLFEIRRKNASH